MNEKNGIQPTDHNTFANRLGFKGYRLFLDTPSGKPADIQHVGEIDRIVREARKDSKDFDINPGAIIRIKSDAKRAGVPEKVDAIVKQACEIFKTDGLDGLTAQVQIDRRRHGTNRISYKTNAPGDAGDRVRYATCMEEFVRQIARFIKSHPERADWAVAMISEAATLDVPMYESEVDFVKEFRDRPSPVF